MGETQKHRIYNGAPYLISDRPILLNMQDMRKAKNIVYLEMTTIAYNWRKLT